MNTSTPLPKKKKKTNDLSIDVVAYDQKPIQQSDLNTELLGLNRKDVLVLVGLWIFITHLLSRIKINKSVSFFVLSNFIHPDTKPSDKLSHHPLQNCILKKPEILKFDSQLREIILSEDPNSIYTFDNFENNFSFMNEFDKCKDVLDMKEGVGFESTHKTVECYNFNDLYDKTVHYDFWENGMDREGFIKEVLEVYGDSYISEHKDDVNEDQMKDIENEKQNATNSLANFLKLSNQPNIKSNDFIILFKKQAIFAHFLPIYLILAKHQKNSLLPQIEAKKSGQRKSSDPLVFMPPDDISYEEFGLIIEYAYKRMGCKGEVIEFLEDERFREVIDFEKVV